MLGNVTMGYVALILGVAKQSRAETVGRWGSQSNLLDGLKSEKGCLLGLANPKARLVGRPL